MKQPIKRIIYFLLLFSIFSCISGCKNPIIERRSPLNQVGTKWQSTDNSVCFEISEISWANCIITTEKGEKIQCVVTCFDSSGTTWAIYSPLSRYNEESSDSDKCYEIWKCYFVDENKFIVSEIVKTTFFSPNTELVFEKIN